MKMSRCFLVTLSHDYYYVHVYVYFLASVCISFPRFYKRGLKQVFKFVETHAKKMSHRSQYTCELFLQKIPQS